MATIAEATFKAIHDVAKLEVGSGDGKFEIKMLPPTKDMYDDMVTLGGIVENAVESGSQAIELHDLLGVVANVMSNNPSLKKITADDLEALGFDTIDVLEFANMFFQFVAKLVQAKN